MEIVSAPATTTYEVRDIDVGLNSGDVRPFTLFSDTDSFSVEAELIRLVIYPRQEDLALVRGGRPERITIFRSAVSWISERERTIQYQPIVDEGRKVDIA